jgi:polar amino acid transport system ATP-binding protein
MRNIRKSFGSLNVLKGVSFEVERGEAVAVIGPSGSGKSTLLRCAAQLEYVDGGDVIIDGCPVVLNGKRENEAAVRSARLKTGFVFQNFNLFPHLSVMRNITEAQIHVLKRSKDEARERARELLKKMGLEEKSGSYPCELSGGQQQRVSIARALALDPKALLFDEPTSALDPEITAEILRILLDLVREKMTMVIVTHEIAFAREAAGRIIFLDGGEIIEQGEAASLIDSPQTERARMFLKKLSDF